MRDNGTPDDPNSPGRPADRLDDTPSTEWTTTASTATRRTRLRALLNPRARLVVAAGTACCLGLVGVSQLDLGAPDRAAKPAPAVELAERAALDAASRGLARPSTAPTTPSASPSPSLSATPKPKVKSTPKAKPKPKPRRIVPVAGLNRTQMDNATKIVRAGREMGVPRRGLVIAVATAMQESTLLNYASGVLPESQSYPHQAVGWDHDSVGLFQQRPSSGWGTVAQLMDPEYATQAFLAALEEIPGWQDLPLSVAAQAVQISAFPDAYAQHEWLAGEVVAEVLG